MPDLTSPLTASNLQELVLQMQKQMEDLYQDRIGGALVGDVFTIGADDILAITAGDGITKEDNELAVEIGAATGLQFSSGALGVKLKSGGGLAVDSDGLALVIASLHNVLSSTHGDTTTASVVAGDLLIGNATPKWDRLAKGVEGALVRAGASLPAWTTATYPATTTAYQLLVSTATSVVGGLTAGTDGKLLRGVSSAVPAWSTLTMPDTIAAGSVFAANTINVLAPINSTLLKKKLINTTGTISWLQYDEIYPEEYGAVGDGTTNDATAIQNAINAAAAAGATLRFMAKTYHTHTAWTLPSNITIIGEGYGTYLLGEGNNNIFTRSGTSIDNIIIANLRIGGAVTGLDEDAVVGIYFSSSGTLNDFNSNISLIDLYIQNCGAGIGLEYGRNVQIINPTIVDMFSNAARNAYGYGIVLNGCSNCQITNPRIGINPIRFDGDPTHLTFVDGGGGADTLTDSDSGFVADGFVTGMAVTISGATTAGNDGERIITNVAAGTLTFATGSWAAGEVGKAAMDVIGNGRIQRHGIYLSNSVLIGSTYIMCSNIRIHGGNIQVTFDSANEIYSSCIEAMGCDDYIINGVQMIGGIRGVNLTPSQANGTRVIVANCEIKDSSVGIRMGPHDPVGTDAVVDYLEIIGNTLTARSTLSDYEAVDVQDLNHINLISNRCYTASSTLAAFDLTCVSTHTLKSVTAAHNVIDGFNVGYDFNYVDAFSDTGSRFKNLQGTPTPYDNGTGTIVRSIHFPVWEGTRFDSKSGADYDDIIYWEQALDAPVWYNSVTGAWETGISATGTATLTNKTFDTAGTGNVFKVNGVTINAVSGTSSTVVLSDGNTSGSSGSCTGNAATATALQNARTIGGVSFNGTANITVASATGGFTVSGGILDVDGQNITIDDSKYLRVDDNNRLVWVSGTYYLTNNGTNFHIISTAGIHKMAAYGAGTATFDANGNISSVSDESLKDIQREFLPGLTELVNLSPIVYKWNQGSGLDTENEYVGFTAQNVKSSLGDVGIGTNKQGKLSYDDRVILATLVNSMKQVKAKIGL